MTEELPTVFLFLTVRARKSGRVVEILSESYEEIKEAAAVYSETDVIARLTASQDRLGVILLELMQRSIAVQNRSHEVEDSFEIDAITPYLVDGTLTRGKVEDGKDLKGDIYSYVLVHIDGKQEARSKVLEDLQQCDGIVYTAGLMRKARAIAKVRAPNKLAFDNDIMEQIQGIDGVATTRSLMIINSMHFIRSENPKVSEQSMNNVAAWASKRERNK
jgi:hypothetical protein